MEKDKIWGTPSGPYFFQNSKRFQGKFLESFIFNNSEVFYRLESRPVRQEGDVLSRQIKFLILASKELESEKVCQFCKEKKIKFFLFLDYRILDFRLSCCDQPACKEALKFGRGESYLMPLNLNGLRQFRGKTMRKKAELFFRQAFGIKKGASPIEIFNKFNEAYLKMVKEQQNKIALHSQKEVSSGSEAELESPDNNKAPILFRTRYYSCRKSSDATQAKLFS